MKFRLSYFVAAIVVFCLSAGIVLAQQSKVIFSYDVLTSPEYAASGAVWQISNNSSDGLFRSGDGMLLKSDGDAYLVYPIQFNYNQYDQLVMTVAADKAVDITVIPDISTTGFHTYELTKRIQPSSDYQTVVFSLHLPVFKNTINDLGINFYSKDPSRIIIKTIRLEPATAGHFFGQMVSDYFLVSPYQPFTVNLFPTPRVLGYSAMVFLLPVVLVLLWLLFTSKQWQRTAAIALLIIWIAIDIRMSYEFLAYNVTDYQTYIQPPANEKTLRTYSDFYQFADWVKVNLPSQSGAISFYSFGSPHFPRVLQYELYPTIVQGENQTAQTVVVYNQPDIHYNASDKKLYQKSSAITGPGTVIATYNQKSFIFSQP